MLSSNFHNYQKLETKNVLQPINNIRKHPYSGILLKSKKKKKTIDRCNNMMNLKSIMLSERSHAQQIIKHRILFYDTVGKAWLQVWRADQWFPEVWDWNVGLTTKDKMRTHLGWYTVLSWLSWWLHKSMHVLKLTELYTRKKSELYIYNLRSKK